MNNTIKELDEILSKEPISFSAKDKLMKLILKAMRINRVFFISSVVCAVILGVGYIYNLNLIMVLSVFVFAVMLLDFITIKVMIDRKILNKLKEYKISQQTDEIILSRDL